MLVMAMYLWHPILAEFGWKERQVSDTSLVIPCPCHFSLHQNTPCRRDEGIWATRSAVDKGKYLQFVICIVAKLQTLM